MSLWEERSENTVSAVWRLLARLALIGALIYAGYRLRSVITTLFVAAVIAYVLDWPVEWLCRQAWFVELHSSLAALGARCRVAYRRVFLRRTSPAPMRARLRHHVVRMYATLYVFILALFVLWQGTVLVVTPFVAEFRAATSREGRRQIAETKENFLVWYDQTVPDWAQSDKVSEQIRKSDISRIAQKMAADFGKTLLESLKNIIEIVLLPVLAFYFLVDGRKLKHEFAALLPANRRREGLRIVHEFNTIMRAFVAGQFILCALAGVVVGLGLALLGVKYPFILGVLAGITRAIPIIGPILGGIPILLLTLATKGLGTALGVLAFFTFLHFAESKFIMPLLIGDRMELHPVIVIVTLIIGGEAGGLLIGGQIGALLGMFFAAPVAAIVRVLVRRYWLRVPKRPPAAFPASLLPVPLTPRQMSETLD